MDVVSILTIILSVFGINLVFFVYLLNRMDAGFREIQKQLGEVRNELQKQLNDLKGEVLWIKFRLDPNEHPHKKDEDAKEN
jgi:hypothetical protein